MAVIQERAGVSFEQVFNAIRLFEEGRQSFAIAADDRGTIVLDGLMRGAVVKANGPEVVSALNMTFARGWAAAHGSLPIGIGIRKLILDVVEISEVAADHAARLICTAVKTDYQTPMNQDSEVIVPFAIYYLRQENGFDDELTVALDSEAS